MSEEVHEEYDARMLTLLQIIWGEGFLSPGGPQAVRSIVDGLDLQDKTVLDIGCGLGGLDEVLAGECGARVTGVDVAKLIVQLGQERIAKSPLRDRIEIRLTEPGPLPFADASFDAVFGKDAWLHIPDKAGFFIEDWRSLTVVLDKGDLRPARMRARKPR